MSDQRQDVGDGALAVQGGRDVRVYQGMTSQDVKTIINELSEKMLLPAYTQAARVEVERRMEEFQAKVLQRFEADATARIEAFAEPDFQATVIAAQRAHARSGDEGVRDVLVDLIARRSGIAQRSRLSLSLNQAVEAAAALTQEEFAALSLCYLVKYTQFNATSYQALVAYIKKHYVPFIAEVPAESSVFQYLEAQGCAGHGFVAVGLSDVLKTNYAGLLSDGAPESAYVGATDEGTVAIWRGSQLLMPCLHNPDLLQLGALNRDVFNKAAAARKLDQAVADKLWAVFEPTIWNANTMPMKLAKDVPEIQRLFEVWTKSGLGNATLTSVGIAIAHASISGRTEGFDADLAIWIK